jgi:hypothetical protein
MAIGQMNKHINHLSMRKLLGIEQKEHGLKSKPGMQDLPAMEQREHGLKRKPTMEQIHRMEEKEHVKKNGDIIIGRGYEKGKKK